VVFYGTARFKKGEPSKPHRQPGVLRRRPAPIVGDRGKKKEKKQNFKINFPLQARKRLGKGACTGRRDRELDPSCRRPRPRVTYPRGANGVKKEGRGGGKVFKFLSVQSDSR